MSAASITVEHGMAVIRIPLEDVHDFRVALSDCPCKATKSTAGKNLRQRLASALAGVGK